MKNLDKFIRKYVPAIPVASRNPMFTTPLAAADKFFSLFFRELKNLPPNKFRIRIGVSNRIFNNHIGYKYSAVNYWMRALNEKAVSMNSNILDIGCGCGRFATVLKDFSSYGSHYGQDGGKYYGIDVDKEMIE
ncbi:MAG: hypothetical protein ACQEP8_04185 [Chlamydiota bacterium]